MLRVSRSPSLLLRQWVPLHPVFDPKPFHTPKFARIVADENQALTASVAADHHVVGADRLAGSLELRPKLAIMCSRLFGERKHVEPCGELLDNREILGGPCRFLGAINHFCERDGGNTQLIRDAVGALAQSCLAVLGDVAAAIDVAHVTQPPRRSPSSTIPLPAPAPN